MLHVRCQKGSRSRPVAGSGENGIMLDSRIGWHRASAVIDQVVDAWLGWSRPPLGAEPIELDPWACWCDRCGASVPDHALEKWVDALGCRRCRGRVRDVDRFVRLGRWEGRLRELVLGLKYHGWWEAADPLGRLLAMRLRPLLLDMPGPVVVVPMPMPRLRRWSRGLDHARLIARAVSRTLGCPLVSPLAMRSCSLQVSASRSQRQSASLGRIRVRRNASKARFQQYFRDATVVLVDDVHTTGRTATAAARQLRTLRPSRLVLAVAAVSDGYSGEGPILG
jgi:predicted amidophosphoribosyltransferase